MRRAVCFFLFFLTLAWAATAAAQKVAIARTPGDRRIAHRVKAELSALGFEVQLVTESSSAEPRGLRGLALDHGAVAGMRASPSKTGIELWIANPNTGATAYEEVVTVASRNDELLALRAVEVLRARLLKLGVLSGEPPPAAEEPAVEEPPRVAPERPVPMSPIGVQLLSVDVGASYAIEPSALSNYESARLGLTLAQTSWWSASTFAVLPLRASELRASEGTARVNATLLAAAGDLHLRHARLRLSFGAGAGLAVLGVSGEADPPYQAQDERLLAAVPFARMAASAAVAERLTLGLEFLAGLAAPPSVVRLDHTDKAEWGSPLLLATFIVQLGILAHDP